MDMPKRPVPVFTPGRNDPGISRSRFDVIRGGWREGESISRRVLICRDSEQSEGTQNRLPLELPPRPSLCRLKQHSQQPKCQAHMPTAAFEITPKMTTFMSISSPAPFGRLARCLFQRSIERRSIRYRTPPRQAPEHYSHRQPNELLIFYETLSVFQLLQSASTHPKPPPPVREA